MKEKVNKVIECIRTLEELGIVIDTLKVSSKTWYEPGDLKDFIYVPEYAPVRSHNCDGYLFGIKLILEND